MGDYQVTNIPHEEEGISPIINEVNGAHIEAAEVVEEVPKRILFRYHFRDFDGDHIDTTEHDQRRILTVDVDDKEDDDDDDSEQLKPAFEIVTEVVVRPLIPPDLILPRPSSPASPKGDDEEPMKKYSKVPPFVIKSISREEMIIHSPGIQKALRSVVHYYPSETLSSRSIRLAEPYYIVLHYRNELEAITSQLEAGLEPHDDDDEDSEGEEPEPWPKNAAIDLRALLDFVIDPKTKKKIAAEEERHRQHPPRVTFEMLWMIFKPGTFVSDGHLNGFVITSLFGAKDWFTGDIVTYTMDIWSLDFNGEEVVRVARAQQTLSSFDGEREITSLEIIPALLNRDGKEIKIQSDLWNKLVNRGQKYWEYLKQGCPQVNYDGKLLNKEQYRYRGKAILDPEKYYRTDYPEKAKPESMDDRDCYCSDCISPGGKEKNEKTHPFHTFKWLDPRPNKDSRKDNCEESCNPPELTPKHFFLLPHEIPGFVLKSRKWTLLDIDCMTPCVPRPDAMDKLRIPLKWKNMIKSLSYKYSSAQRKDDVWSADFIQDKGEGQIFLLHGPSGVGKTYTAECVSELTGRPLITLSVANIGTDEVSMESELAKWFDYAEQWEAIMLIDEADVYFERRSSGQLQRNSLVSAFLRSMEYYRGILFLTTNRLGSVDDAILSRIHLVIEYKDLDKEDRLQIWAQFSKKLISDRKNYYVCEETENFWENSALISELEWNGREIRNAFQTAVALAEYDSIVTKEGRPERILIQKNHLEDVAHMSKAFKTYMKDFVGDPSQRAFVEGARKDDSIRAQQKERKEQYARARQATRENARSRS